MFFFWRVLHVFGRFSSSYTARVGNPSAKKLSMAFCFTRKVTTQDATFSVNVCDVGNRRHHRLRHLLPLKKIHLYHARIHNHLKPRLRRRCYQAATRRFPNYIQLRLHFPKAPLVSQHHRLLNYPEIHHHADPLLHLYKPQWHRVLLRITHFTLLQNLLQ